VNFSRGKCEAEKNEKDKKLRDEQVSSNLGAIREKPGDLVLGEGQSGTPKKKG
jgi:hypothetical protein